MKKIILYIVAVITLLSCIDEVALPVTVKFETEVINQDNTVPVKVKITNDTEGADTYKWSFEGATPNSSSSKNPGVIIYDNAGEYTITLEASNRDGSVDRKEEKVVVKPDVNIGFMAEVIADNFSPLEVKITNNTIGATTYDWIFEGGVPSSSKKQHPENVIFKAPGAHKITLKVTNGEEEYTQEKVVTVKPYLVTDFEYSVPFEDDDFQVPVIVNLKNKSISATSYKWIFEGTTTLNSSEENPQIEFKIPGTYTIQLKAGNGKEEKVFSKTIKVVENTNLRTFENIELGINTSHKNNKRGAFFSTITRQVYSQNQITEAVASKIDIAFFGLNSDFTFNKFVSPDQVQNSAFKKIQNASTTKFINKMESCTCSTSLSVFEFNGIKNDDLLSNLTIEETASGLKEFNSSIQPRIVVFETKDKRKGAIKIKEFKKVGVNSFNELL
ncbi:PKD domain-containing protein [Tenacibaculum sp.]|nr:PKD domain-containing protein [Tenacibaculum sp.]